jgi:rhodanese-related sulfurtransferase
MFIIMLIILIVSVYRRYYPVNWIPCVSKINNSKDNNIIVLDIRDYTETSKNPVSSSLNIPYAYLKRFYKEIPNRPIHVIASDELERNLGLRFLLHRGFHVTSYYLTECPCDENDQKEVS